MKQILGIVIMKTEEKFHLKDAKAIEMMFKIAFCLLAILFVFWAVRFTAGIRSLKFAKYMEPLSGYSVYQIHSSRQNMLSEKYPPITDKDRNNNLWHSFTAYLGELQNKYGLKVIACRQIVYGNSGSVLTITYANPEEMDSSYEELGIPLKSGRFFEGSEDAVIVLKGDYKAGDRVSVTDKEGKSHSVPVVAVSEIPKIPGWESSLISGGTDLFYNLNVSRAEEYSTVLFLNPKSQLNQYENEINYCMLVQADDPILLKELKDNGALYPVENAIKRTRRRFITALLLTILFGLLFSGTVFFMDYYGWKKYRKRLFFLGVFVGAAFGVISSSGYSLRFEKGSVNLPVTLIVWIGFMVSVILFSAGYFKKAEEEESINEDVEDFERVSLKPENYKEKHTNWEA